MYFTEWGRSKGTGESIERVAYMHGVRVLASSWGYRGQFTVGFLTVGPFISAALVGLRCCTFQVAVKDSIQSVCSVSFDTDIAQDTRYTAEMKT